MQEIPTSRQVTVIDKTTHLAPIVFALCRQRPEWDRQVPSGDSITVPRSKAKRKYTQLHLNFGQTTFASVKCKECGMRYTPGSETDEATHRAYHEEYTNSLIPFKRVAVHDRVLGVNEERGEKYIQLESQTGSRRNTKRVKELYARIENVCQSPVLSQLQDCHKVYICVKRSTIIGCLVLEPLQEAKSMITNEGETSPENYVESAERRCVNCGVVTIWTHQTYRKQGVATRLLDISKRNFIFGYDIPRGALAFKQPVPDGQHFAFRFCQGPFAVY